MEFRKDIQGMRAIAVLSILVFHIDPRLRGGFVGVDVFFVISGFLITSIIWNGIEKQTFSISRFYIKRIRRLFPALFTMLLGVLGLVLFSGYRDEIKIFAESALSSLYYVSNIFFFTQNDYFSPDLELNPLLHTWSLSVEEQFYLFFPLYILLLSKFRAQAARIIIATLLVSLIGSEAMLHIDPRASFFLSPSRFWQFLTGSLLALTVGRKTLSPKLSNVCAYSGVALIFGSILFISKDMKFPGLLALLPTGGAALLIIGGKERSTLVYKALASRPMVFVGTISYSLYLWHWPAIVLYKLNISPTLSFFDKAILFVGSFLLAYLSWRLVESKNSGWGIFQRGKSTAVFFVTTLVVFSTAFLGARAYGAGAFGKPTSPFEKYFTYNGQHRSRVCFLHSGADSIKFFKEDKCIKQGPGKNVLLLGDSHAAHLYHALLTHFPDITFSQATVSGCKPVVHTKGAKRCVDLIGKALNEYVVKKHFDAIIVAARWGGKDGGRVRKTVDYLEKYVDDIIVVGPVVEYKQPLSKLLAKFGYSRLKESPRITGARRWKERKAADVAIGKALAGTKAHYVSAIDRMCPGGHCITVSNGVPVQWDYGHLTTEGALLIVRDLF